MAKKKWKMIVLISVCLPNSGFSLLPGQSRPVTQVEVAQRSQSFLKAFGQAIGNGIVRVWSFFQSRIFDRWFFKQKKRPLCYSDFPLELVAKHMASHLSEPSDAANFLLAKKVLDETARPALMKDVLLYGHEKLFQTKVGKLTKPEAKELFEALMSQKHPFGYNILHLAILSKNKSLALFIIVAQFEFQSEIAFDLRFQYSVNGDTPADLFARMLPEDKRFASKQLKRALVGSVYPAQEIKFCPKVREMHSKIVDLSDKDYENLYDQNIGRLYEAARRKKPLDWNDLWSLLPYLARSLRARMPERIQRKQSVMAQMIEQALMHDKDRAPLELLFFLQQLYTLGADFQTKGLIHNIAPLEYFLIRLFCHRTPKWIFMSFSFLALMAPKHRLLETLVENDRFHCIDWPYDDDYQIVLDQDGIAHVVNADQVHRQQVLDPLEIVDHENAFPVIDRFADKMKAIIAGRRIMLAILLKQMKKASDSSSLPKFDLLYCKEYLMDHYPYKTVENLFQNL